jgi:hypothetical protein
MIKPHRQRWVRWALVAVMALGVIIAFRGFETAAASGNAGYYYPIQPLNLTIVSQCQELYGGYGDTPAKTNCEEQTAIEWNAQAAARAEADQAAASTDKVWGWLGVVVALGGLIGLLVWSRMSKTAQAVKSRFSFCDARLRPGVIKCAKCGSATVGPDALVLLEALNAGTPIPNFMVDHPALAQRLLDAERDPEKVYAVVEGTGVQVLVVEGFLVEVPRDPTDKVDALALRKVHNAWFGDGQQGRGLYVESDDFQWWSPDINPDMGTALASWLRTSRLQSAR